MNVLVAVVATWLITNLTETKPGDDTNINTCVTSKESLNAYARQFKLGNLAKFTGVSESAKAIDTAPLSDIFLAFMGATFLSSPLVYFNLCFLFFKDIVKDREASIVEEAGWTMSKSIIMEIGTKFGIGPLAIASSEDCNEQYMILSKNQADTLTQTCKFHIPPGLVGTVSGKLCRTTSMKLYKKAYMYFLKYGYTQEYINLRSRTSKHKDIALRIEAMCKRFDLSCLLVDVMYKLAKNNRKPYYMCGITQSGEEKVLYCHWVPKDDNKPSTQSANKKACMQKGLPSYGN